MKSIRKSRTAGVLGLAGMIVILAGCTPATEKPTANAQPEFKGVVPINDVMVSVVDHNSHILWNAADPKMAPKTDQDWHALEHAATTLAASGNMILIPGPPKDDQEWVKDPRWQKHAQDMTNAGLKAIQAVDKRDLTALQAAGDELVVTCEACHKDFKPALPAHIAKPSEQPEHFSTPSEK